MNLKKKLSCSGLLYLILDKQTADNLKIDLTDIAKKLAGSEVDLFQLRAKGISDPELLNLSRQLSLIFKKARKDFIINDRADIAYLSGASGLHLGCSDINEKDARILLGKKIVLGKTIHSFQEFKKVELNYIDYLSLGPFFDSQTKQPNRMPLTPPEIKKIISENKKVMFAIGGINRYNIYSLLEAGIKNIAVSSAVVAAPSPLEEIKELKRCLKKAS